MLLSRVPRSDTAKYLTGISAYSSADTSALPSLLPSRISCGEGDSITATTFSKVGAGWFGRCIRLLKVTPRSLRHAQKGGKSERLPLYKPG